MIHACRAHLFLPDKQPLALTTLCPAVAALSEDVFGDVTVPASCKR